VRLGFDSPSTRERWFLLGIWFPVDKLVNRVAFMRTHQGCARRNGLTAGASAGAKARLGWQVLVSEGKLRALKAIERLTRERSLQKEVCGVVKAGVTSEPTIVGSSPTRAGPSDCRCSSEE